MSDQNFKIIVGADTSNAVQGLSNLGDTLDVTNLTLLESTKKLADFYKLLNQTNNPVAIKAYETSIISLEAHIEQLEAAGVKAAAAQKGLNDAVSQGSSIIGGTLTQQRVALTDLGRAVTGTGFSVRSLVSNISLLGPVGVLAVGAIYEIGKALLSQTDAEKAASKAAEELKKTLEDLKSASTIIAEATGGSAGQIAQVRDLAAAVTDSTLTYKERKSALEELQKINKAYFGDLTVETASYGVLAAKVQEYANALVSAAVVKGFSEEISKTTVELSKQEETLGRLKKQYDDAQAAQKAFTAAPVQAGGRGGGTGTSADALEQNKLAAQVNISKKAFEDQRSAVFELANSVATYTGNLENAIKTQIQFDQLKPPKAPKAPKEEQEDRLSDLPVNLEFLDTSNFVPKINTTLKKLSKSIAPVDVPLTVDEKELNAKATAVAADIQKIFDDAGKQGAIDIAASIGNALGKGQNVLAAALGGLLGFLGDGIEEIGKDLIVIGSIAQVAATAIKTLLQSPGLSIAAGIAFVAVGAALKAKASNVHAFAEGGVVTGPTLGLVGEAGPEAIIPLRQLDTVIRKQAPASAQSVEVYGRLSGTNTYIQQKRVSKQQNMV